MIGKVDVRIDRVDEGVNRVLWAVEVFWKSDAKRRFISVLAMANL